MELGKTSSEKIEFLRTYFSNGLILALDSQIKYVEMRTSIFAPARRFPRRVF